MAVSQPIDKPALLRRVSIFSQLENRELESLARYTVTKALKPREVLCRKGDEGSQAYVIAKGRLKITTAAEDGKELVLRIMGPGEVVGEIALLDSELRATAVVGYHDLVRHTPGTRADVVKRTHSIVERAFAAFIVVRHSRHWAENN